MSQTAHADLVDHQTLSPRPQQAEALHALHQAFEEEHLTRGQLIMACGTGKTLVGRWSAEAFAAQRVLVLVPTLTLLSQTLREWRRAGRWTFDALIVCSDPSTAEGAAEREDDEAGMDGLAIPESILPPVTTDPEVAAQFLLARRAGQPQVIFSTYHSAHVMAAAQALAREAVDTDGAEAGTAGSAPLTDIASDEGLGTAATAETFAFDLAILDEAHRLAGQASQQFRVVLDENRLAIRRRLSMTATRVVIDRTILALEDAEQVLSMDQEAIFGPVIHRIGFAQAIAADLLCDWRLLVVARRAGGGGDDQVTSDSTPLNVEPGALGSTAESSNLPRQRKRSQENITAVALAGAIDRYGVRRVLSFHGRRSKAEAFTRVIDQTTTPGGIQIRSRAVHGLLSAAKRATDLEWLAAEHPQIAEHPQTPDVQDVPLSSSARLITSVRCLSEGIDVPAVDAVVFADPRGSQVDVTQAIGRTLRPSPGKKTGLIILPVELPAEDDDDGSWLTASAWAPVWAVLRTLRIVDSRLDLSIAAAQRHQISTASRGTKHPQLSLPDSIEFDLPADLDDLDLADLQVRLVEEVGVGWESYYAQAQAWASEHPGRRMAAFLTWQGRPLGTWAQAQRTARQKGLLPAERIRKLDEIPGWVWDRAEADWHNTLATVRTIAEQGGLDSASSTSSPYQGHRSQTQPQVHLGTWVAWQRQAWRAGTLDPGHHELLQSIPSWHWQVLPTPDLHMVDALGRFVAREKHADVPADFTTPEGLHLGRWVWNVRRRDLAKTLHPTLREEIIAAAGHRWKAHAGFSWEKNETRWLLSLAALKRFAERENSAAPPNRHQETVVGVTINLYQWVAVQRHRRNKGELDPAHQKALEAVPGWMWEGPGRRQEAGEPIDLQGHPHGTAKGRAAKCPCSVCLESRREYDRQRLAAARQAQEPVPAAPAREHLQAVLREVQRRLKRPASEADRAGKTSIAVIANVPVAVVRQALGDAQDLERAHADALLQVTAEQVAEAASSGGAGSRGRLIAGHQERLPAAPTHAVLARLAARGFGVTWVNRELGFNIQIQANTITRRVADQIADLERRVGDLRWHGPANRRVPALAALRAAHLEQAAHIHLNEKENPHDVRADA